MRKIQYIYAHRTFRKHCLKQLVIHIHIDHMMCTGTWRVRSFLILCTSELCIEYFQFLSIHREQKRICLFTYFFNLFLFFLVRSSCTHPFRLNMLGIADILHLDALQIGMPMRQKKHFLIEIIANKNHNENCRKK